MSNLVPLPIILPLLTGALLLFWRERIAYQRWLSAVSMTAGLLVAARLMRAVVQDGIQPYHAGNWPPPFAITLVADLMSSAFVLVTAVTALAVLCFSFYSLSPEQEKHYYYAGFHFLLVGVNGSILTGDIFNLFVFFEVLLLASYMLMALGGRAYQLQETFKYVIINSVGSSVFLFGIASLYSAYGTLNLADLALRAMQGPSDGWLSVIAMLFLIVFGLKAAAFPLHFWLPRSYFAAPTVIIAFFGGILTKVGVYAILRTFTLIFVDNPAFTHQGVLLPLAALTMVLGILGAIAQSDFKRILSYHIISQIGYMLMGIALFTPLAIAGTIVFVAHQMIVKTVLFLTAGVAEAIGGTTDLRRTSGLLATHGLLAALFLIAALALIGVPPLSGFFAKFPLMRAGLEIGRFGTVAVALAVGLGTLFSMIKIFRFSFWGEVKGDRRLPALSPHYRRMMLPIGVLAALSLAMGMGSEHVLNYALAAAEQALDRQAYIQAVLPGFSLEPYGL